MTLRYVTGELLCSKGQVIRRRSWAGGMNDGIYICVVELMFGKQVFQWWRPRAEDRGGVAFDPVDILADDWEIIPAPEATG